MLYILEKDYSKIIKHCMEWLPYEACGLARSEERRVGKECRL